MRFFTEKTLNWLFTILLITLVLYLISVFVADIVDRRVSGVRVSLPVNQRGGVAPLAEVEGTPQVVTVQTVQTAQVEPVTTYTAVPAAIPVPVVSPAVSTAPLPSPNKVIVGLPTPTMTTVPLSSVPAAAATAELTVAPASTAPVAVTTTQPLPQPVQPVQTVQTIQPVQTVQTVQTVQPVAVTQPVRTVQTVQPVAVTTFYKDPREMTPEQLRKFKEQATFAKMTLQDYRNWLNLWRDDFVNLQRLFPAHVVNYQKFISGQPLVMSDLQLVVTSVALPVAVKTPGLDTAQGLYGQFFLGDQYAGLYPSVYASYPNVTTIPLQIATTPLPVVIS
jgi:hypothetical protein